MNTPLFDDRDRCSLLVALLASPEFCDVVAFLGARPTDLGLEDDSAEYLASCALLGDFDRPAGSPIADQLTEAYASLEGGIAWRAEILSRDRPRAFETGIAALARLAHRWLPPVLEDLARRVRAGRVRVSPRDVRWLSLALRRTQGGGRR
jgi:hypothetical protein